MRLVALLALALPAAALAAPDATTAQAQLTEALARGDWLLLPHIAYAPESSLTAGATAQFVYRDPEVTGEGPRAAPSIFRLGASYSLRDQFELGLTPEIRLAEGFLTLRLDGRYARVRELYFGVGNDTERGDVERYLADEAEMRGAVFARLPAGFAAGVVLEWRQYDVSDLDPEGELVKSPVTGRAGSSAAGVGAGVRFDTRDAPFAPTEGTLAELRAVRNAHAIGGEADFDEARLDARQYLIMAERRHGPWVLATQLVAHLQHGRAPFAMLAALGGTDGLRGVYAGRFRDRHMLFGQAELRVPLRDDVGAVVFGGAGQVAPALDGFAARGWHPAGGAGLRFALPMEPKLHLRFDGAVSGDDHGAYFALGEAF